MARVEKPSALKVTPGEKAEVKVLVERVVYLIHEGMTDMDLLEVFLRRRIQPLQARDHPMWMYSGIKIPLWCIQKKSTRTRWRSG